MTAQPKKKSQIATELTFLYQDLDTYYQLTLEKKVIEDEQAVLNKKIKKELGVRRLGELAEILIKDDDPEEPNKLLSSTRKRIEDIIVSGDYERALKYTNFDYVVSDRTAKIISQDQSKIDPGKTQSFIESRIRDLTEVKYDLTDQNDTSEAIKLLSECLQTKVVINEEAVAEVINKGLITPDEFKASCINEKIIVTLRVVETK